VTDRLPRFISRDYDFVTRRVLTPDGVEISLVDEGPRDAPVLLFVHGNPTWSYLWRHLLRAGLEAGFRVVAPDHAGFGLSDKPTKGTYYSLERHVANLRHVVRDLDLQDITLVIHDWGGPIGMGMAVDEPARIGRIVVTNTTTFPPRTRRALSPWHALFSFPPGYKLGTWLNLVEFTAMTLGTRKPLSFDTHRAYAWPMRERGGRLAAARFVQMVPDAPDHISAGTLRDINQKFHHLGDTPVLVLWADHDPVFRPRLAERWLKTDLNVVDVRHIAPDASHFWQEDAPETFAPHILSFARGNK